MDEVTNVVSTDGIDAKAVSENKNLASQMDDSIGLSGQKLRGSTEIELTLS